jgi:hypothetical protein
MIDLEMHNALRDERAIQPSPVVLHTGMNELTIKLPLGSPKGAYQLRLADPFGNPLQSVDAISHDGRRLRTHLNLNSVKPGQYSICLAREMEVPQCVLVIVEPNPMKK